VTKATSAATRFTSTQLSSVVSHCRRHRRGGIEIHTDRARLEVLHPSASALHFFRRHSSEHFDRAFGNRKIRGSAPSRVRQRGSRQRRLHPRSYARTPASVATNGPQGSMSIMRRVPGRLSPRFRDRPSNVVDEHLNIPLVERWRNRRRLKGEQPTVDLMIGYRKGDASPILKTFLSRIGGLIDRAPRRKQNDTVPKSPRHVLVMRLD
jgi:hypothetical protein